MVVDTTNAEAAHGGAIRIPQPRTVLSVPMNGPVDVERVVEALAKPHPVAGELRFPEGLNTTAHQLVILTSFLAEQGIDPRRAFRVRWMRTSSAYLNAGATRRISALWGIPIGDQFSLSEIFGGAWKCLTCGWYHPDPFVAPEVVDQRTGARLVRGPGVLVLTELFPFVQAHPFIRYWTGDVVEAGPTDCEGSPFAFRYLGRTGRRPGGIGGLSRSLPKHASQGVVSDEDGTLLVGPAPLLDLLGDEEGIAREPIGGAWGERPDPLGLGKPMFALRFEPGRPSVVRLSVSVDRPDELDPALAARLHAVLLDHNPELASRFAQKRLAIDVAFVDRGRHHDDAHRTGSVPGGR